MINITIPMNIYLTDKAKKFIANKIQELKDDKINGSFALGIYNKLIRS